MSKGKIKLVLAGVIIWVNSYFCWSNRLHDAVRCGDVAVVQDILSRGGKGMINAKDKKGRTPLHIAVKEKSIEIVNLLLSCKAINVNTRDKEDMTPLHIAADVDKEDESSIEIVNLFLNCNSINVNAIEGIVGWTPLHCAVNNNNVKIVEALLAHNPDINIKDAVYMTPYMLALILGHEEVAALLAMKHPRF